MESFRTRGGQLAGFGAVFLGLLGSLLSDGLSGLSGPPNVLGTALYGFGLLAVLASLLISLGSVVRPVRGRSVSPSLSLHRYLTTAALLKAETWQHEMRTLRSYPDVLRRQGWINRRLAGALYVASAALAAGLLATTLCLIIILADA